MSSIVRAKKLAKGKMRYFIDTHYKGIRKYDHPAGLVCKQNPATEAERREKKEKKMLAEEIARKIEMDLLRGDYNLWEKHEVQRDFVQYAEDWIEQHTALLDIRMYRSALAKLVEFKGRKKIPCVELNETFWKRFASFLKQSLNGATPNNYLKKLKRIVKAATDDKLFRIDPVKDITISTKAHHIKDVLTMEEIGQLWRTPCGRDDVKRAFLFSCLTGLRFCDVVLVQWKHISGNKLSIIQHKTKLPVSQILVDDAIGLLGERAGSHDKVFNLPSHTACLKWLDIWSEDAGVSKNVSWHVARHSFGTNLVAYGGNLAVVSKLLGHSSLKYTQTYVRISDEQKTDALNNLPSISQTQKR